MQIVSLCSVGGSACCMRIRGNVCAIFGRHVCRGSRCKRIETLSRSEGNANLNVFSRHSLVGVGRSEQQTSPHRYLPQQQSKRLVSSIHENHISAILIHTEQASAAKIYHADRLTEIIYAECARHELGCLHFSACCAQHGILQRCQLLQSQPQPHNRSHSHSHSRTVTVIVTVTATVVRCI